MIESKNVNDWFVKYTNIAAKYIKLSSFYNPGLWRFNRGFDNVTGMRFGFLSFGEIFFLRVGKVWDTYAMVNE